MRLVVTDPTLDEALKPQGKDWTTFTRQEVRSVVCAICHVGHKFSGEGKSLTLPWKNETSIGNFERYYVDEEFTDWQRSESGAEMIKMQHPDCGLFLAGSTHYSAGISCADCHMANKAGQQPAQTWHCQRKPTICTRHRSFAGILSLQKTAWDFTTQRGRCPFRLQPQTCSARRSSRSCNPLS